MIPMIIDHLWESSLFALAAACATLAFRGNGAHVRYWLWFAASVKFLIPFALFAALGRRFGPETIAFVPPAPVTAVFETLSAPTIVSAGATATGPINPAVLLAAVWAFGVVAVLSLWVGKWLRIRRTLRAATPLSFDAPIVVKATPTHFEPGLVGIFRPVLLLPEGLATHLTAPELRAVVAHELCHLRRRDNLTAAIHMVVQALVWFHPLVWWIGTRLVAERENACDEAVLKTGGNPATYAESILKVCKLYVASPLICASGVSGADLESRIKRIFVNRSMKEVGVMKAFFIGSAAFAAVVCPIVLGWSSAPSQAAAASPAKSRPVYVDLPPGLVHAINQPGAPKVHFFAALEVNCATNACAREVATITDALPRIIGAFQGEPALASEEVKGIENMLRLKDIFLARANAAVGPGGLVKDLVFKAYYVLAGPTYNLAFLNVGQPEPKRKSGAPSNSTGLRLSQTPSVLVHGAGMDVLVVKGQITNIGTTARNWPGFKMRLVNSRNDIVGEQMGLPPYGGTLEPSASMDFEFALQAADAASMKLVAAWNWED